MSLDLDQSSKVVDVADKSSYDDGVKHNISGLVHDACHPFAFVLPFSTDR